MDAIDPQLVEQTEQVAGAVGGVQSVHDVRARWVGHQLQAEIHIVVDEDLPTRESHAVAEAVRHALHHDLAHLSQVSVHVDPCGHSGSDAHAGGAH